MIKMKLFSKKHSSFTLVETLVAVFIFTVVITAGMSAMTMMMNSRSKLTGAKEVQEAGRLVVESISNEAKKQVYDGTNHFEIIDNSGAQIAETGGVATGGRVVITQTDAGNTTVRKIYQLQNIKAPYEVFDDGICGVSQCKVSYKIDSGNWNDLTSSNVNVSKLQFEGVQWSGSLTRHQFLTITFAADNLKTDATRKDRIVLRTTVTPPKDYVMNLPSPDGYGPVFLGYARLFKDNKDQGDYLESSIGLWKELTKPPRNPWENYRYGNNQGFISWSAVYNGRLNQCSVDWYGGAQETYYEDCLRNPGNESACLEAMRGKLIEQNTEIRVFDYAGGGLFGIAHLYKYNPVSTKYDDDRGKFIEASIGLITDTKYYASWTTSTSDGSAVADKWSQIGDCDSGSTPVSCLATARQALVDQNFRIRVRDEDTGGIWGNLYLADSPIDPENPLELLERSIIVYEDLGTFPYDPRDPIDGEDPLGITGFSWTRHDASNSDIALEPHYFFSSPTRYIEDARRMLRHISASKRVVLVGKLPESWSYE